MADADKDVCRCATPKPVRVTDETFEGLFSDVPVTSTNDLYCDQCAGVVMRARVVDTPIAERAR